MLWEWTSSVTTYLSARPCDEWRVADWQVRGRNWRADVYLTLEGRPQELFEVRERSPAARDHPAPRDDG